VKRINETDHVYIRNGVLYVYGRIDYKTCRYSTGKKATKANVQWAKREWESIIREKIKGRHKTPALGEYGAKALDLSGYKRKQSTNDGYRYLFQRFVMPHFAQTPIGQISSSDICLWQKHLLSVGVSAHCIKSARKALSAIFNYAQEDGLIEKNPLFSVRAPKVTTKERQPFSLDETRLILEKAKGQFKEFLTVSFFTGLRTGEAMALEWSHIDFKTKTIKVRQTMSAGRLGTPKTPHSVRDVDMLPIVERSLRRQYDRTKDKGSFVFASRLGGGYKRISYLRGQWKKLLSECGLDYRAIYVTRHTFASIMLSEGEEAMWISRTLGHKNLSITLSIYAKYVPKKQIARAIFLEGFMEK
jgi:integrase